jgi:hypothetical protein
MAYSGSTAASTVANPPSRIDAGLLSQRNIRESTSLAEGGALWTYTSTNLTTDLTAASFFSDADRLGMRNGDILMSASYTSEGSSSILVIGVIQFDSTSAASIGSTGSMITSTFA